MKRLLIFVFTFSLLGCKQPLDKNFEVIKDDYKVGYHGKSNENIFVKHKKDIGMMAVIVNKKIKRIGFNDKFAIIERVGNYNDVDASTEDTLVVRYYIVDMSIPINVQDKNYLFGPAKYEDFVIRKEELGIRGLDFTKEYSVN